MHPPLLPISQTSIFSTFKKLKHLTQEFGLAVNIEECRKGNWIATTFVTNLGWLTLKERVGNEQDGNARPFNLKTFTALIFKLLSCSFSSTFRIHFRSSPEPVGRKKNKTVCVCVLDTIANNSKFVCTKSGSKKLFPEYWPNLWMLTCTCLSLPWCLSMSSELRISKPTN